MVSKQTKKGNQPVKPSQKAKDKKLQAASDPMVMKPWIAMRTGVIVIAIVSIGLSMNTGYQAYLQGRSIPDAIMLGFLFGGSIWMVFLAAFLFHRLVRRNREK
jgi:hypothetical protein